MKRCKKMTTWEHKEVSWFELGLHFWFGLLCLFYLEALLCCPDWPYLLGSGNPFDLASGLLSLSRATGTNIEPRKGLLYFAFRSERPEAL